MVITDNTTLRYKVIFKTDVKFAVCGKIFSELGFIRLAYPILTLPNVTLRALTNLIYRSSQVSLPCRGLRGLLSFIGTTLCQICIEEVTKYPNHFDCHLLHLKYKTRKFSSKKAFFSLKNGAESFKLHSLASKSNKRQPWKYP